MSTFTGLLRERTRSFVQIWMVLVTTGLESTEGLALDLADGKMYWIDCGTAKVQRANLDGSDVEDLVWG